ncbi:MAG: hypothetical protein E6Q97_31325 [Desulfurellales bacterium]|nr:MAG: hypothetical protein E6Q97_31325 [Desulfurellales bacterium]
MAKYGRLSTKQTIAIARYVDEQGLALGDEQTVAPGETRAFFRWGEGASDEALQRLVNDIEPDRHVSLEAVRRARQQAGGLTFDEWRRTDEGKRKTAEQVAQLNLPPPAAQSELEKAIDTLDTVLLALRRRVEKIEERMTNLEAGVDKFPQLFDQVREVRDGCRTIREQLEGLAKHVENGTATFPSTH